MVTALSAAIVAAYLFKISTIAVICLSFSYTRSFFRTISSSKKPQTAIFLSGCLSYSFYSCDSCSLTINRKYSLPFYSPRQPINNHVSPFRAQALWNIPELWRRAVSARSQLHPLNIGRGLVRVDVFFSSFICAKRKDITFCFFSKRRITPFRTLAQKPLFRTPYYKILIVSALWNN